MGFLIAALLLLCLLFLLPALKRARRYVNDVSTCGFLPPPPTERSLRWMRRLVRPWVFLQVGKITVIGRENLLACDGGVITTPNHSHPADNFLMPYVLNRATRYMAARGWMRIGGGLGALITGPMGAFCVDTRPGMGRPAQDAAVRVVVSGQHLNIFPEGGAFPDGDTRNFKTGAVRIAQESARQLGRCTFIVPTYIRYGRYAGPWIMRLPEPIRYAVIFFNPWYFRRGVTVVFGTPIASDSLPEDPTQATDVLRQRVLALDPARPRH